MKVSKSEWTYLTGTRGVQYTTYIRRTGFRIKFAAHRSASWRDSNNTATVRKSTAIALSTTDIRCNGLKPVAGRAIPGFYHAIRNERTAAADNTVVVTRKES